MCLLTHTHTHTHKPSWNHLLRVTTEESGLIATWQMLPTHPAPSPPQQPRGKDCLLCSGLPASVFRDVSAPALHILTSASLTDPAPQAVLQGSSKSQVSLFCRRLGAEFTSSQRDLCNPRVQGVSLAPAWGQRDPFSRWKQELGPVCVCVRRGRISEVRSSLQVVTLFLSGAQTIVKIPLIQGLWCEYWCESPVYCWSSVSVGSSSVDTGMT